MLTLPLSEPEAADTGDTLSAKRRPRVLFIHNYRSTFVSSDIELLSERFDVHELFIRSRLPRSVTTLREVAACDLVFGWFAGPHTLLPFIAARVMRRPSIVVAGGYDVARVPELDYGSQRGGPRRWVSRAVLRCASVVIASSRFGAAECIRNAGVSPRKVRAVYCGIDPSKTVGPSLSPRTGVLTVSRLDRSSVKRKGVRRLMEAAALLPDTEFTVAGYPVDDTIAALRANAPPNVAFPERRDVTAEFARHCVYVQASRYEQLGVAVIEAMAAGCIPVLTRVGGLPEVGGELATYVDAEPSSAELAAAIQSAVERADAEPDLGSALRQRAVDSFGLERRRSRLGAIVDALLEGGELPGELPPSDPEGTD